MRHKVLDLIGDLSLVGRPVFGRLVAHKSGHELNHMLARRLLDEGVYVIGFSYPVVPRGQARTSRNMAYYDPRLADRVRRGTLRGAVLDVFDALHN